MNISPLRPGSGAPIQGAIYAWPGPGFNLVVLSSDDHNSRLDPLCAPLVRSTPVGPYVVATDEEDSVAGRVVVNLMVRVPRGELGAHRGVIAGTTWSKIQAALRLLFNLPPAQRPRS